MTWRRRWRNWTQRGVSCEPIRIDEYTGRRFTFFADPDGLPLELYEAAKETAR